MGRLFSRRKYRDLMLGLALLCAVLALMRWPQESMAAARDGLALCGNVIIPSLFPFFVLSSLVVELGMSRYLGRLLEGVMAPLFRVGGACSSALALGFVGGYPVGARTAIALYENGQCSKTEAERLLAFCNNSGPAFILGVVGTGIFASSPCGAAPLSGTYRRFPVRRPALPLLPARRGAPAGTPCGPPVPGSQLPRGLHPLHHRGPVLHPEYLCLRAVFHGGHPDALSLRRHGRSGRRAAALLSPLGLDQAWAQRLITGLLELSSGVSSLTGAGTVTGRLSMAAFMLGWAGLSVHCQVLAFLGDSGLSLRTYLTGKLLHGGLSALFTALLVRRFPLEAPVSSYLAEQVEGIASLDFQRALTISTAAAWGVWLLFVALAVYMVKKSSGKPRPKRV